MPDVESFQHNLEGACQAILSAPGFDAWIKTTRPLRLDNNQLQLEIPSTVHRGCWEKNLSAEIVETGFKLVGVEVMPHFVATDEKDTALAQELEKPTGEEVVFSGQNKKAMLNPKYTSDTFVTGKGSQMAHITALVVVEDPDSVYNSLFFYGDIGLGKTHLMHAIGHQMLVDQPDAKVKCVSNGTSMNEFINSIQAKTFEQFRKEYRNVDLLSVDDIQFLAEKEAALEEFFHTFNGLYNENKQIVSTNDRPPSNTPKLPERLISRFARGLSVDITPSDLETRTAISRKKADTERLEISDDTLSYIAGQIDSDIRGLEGTLVRVRAFATINGEDITTSLVADALKSLKSVGSKSQLSILQIQEEVFRYYHVPLKDLKGRKRVKTIVVSRQISVCLAREITDNSLPKISAEFGGKDHTAVIHAHEKIQRLLEKDPAIQKEASEVRNLLNSQNVES